MIKRVFTRNIYLLLSFPDFELVRDDVEGLLALGLPILGFRCDLALLGRAGAALPPDPLREPLPWTCEVSELNLEEETALSPSEPLAFTSP